jgi:predicted ATPase
MKIEKVRIQNLRAFKDVEVGFNDYTCMVGANGAGKSTVLCALNIFFRQTENTGTNLQKLDKEDFFGGDTEHPIRITVTFGDLSAEALERFKDYARAGKLIITAAATYNEANEHADVKHFGERSGMTAFMPFFAAYGDGASAGDLKVIYEGLRERFDLPKASTKDGNRDALRSYEDARPDECELIPSEDQFYGVSKGANRLAEFVQWVYVPAIKDALTEQVEAKDSALGKLLARTVRAKTNFAERLSVLRSATSQAYQDLLADNQSALDDISSSLSKRLSEWAHPDTSLKLEWQQDKERSVRIDEPWAHVKVGEGVFEGKLARLGHGLQRSYIIALLQELAAFDGDAGPKLLLAIEEPELYQHPPQARHLAGVLQSLSSDSAQVMVSTHSPYFVSGEVFEDVRVVRRADKKGSSTVCWSTFEKAAQEITAATGKPFGKRAGVVAKLQQTLQPNLAELFFASKVVLVEGREDAAYLQTALQLADEWNNFRKHGGYIVPVDGKSEILRPLVVAKLTSIPCFVIWDSDGDETNADRRSKHERDNSALMKALGIDDGQPFPPATRWGGATSQSGQKTLGQRSGPTSILRFGRQPRIEPMRSLSIQALSLRTFFTSQRGLSSWQTLAYSLLASKNYAAVS